MTTTTPKIVSKVELAEHFDISLAQIGQYQQLGMPIHKVGQGKGSLSEYILEDCIAWHATQFETEEKESYNAAKLRQAVANASLAELALQRERGEVIEITEVTHLVSSEYSKIRNLLLSLPSKLSGLIHSLESQKEIKDVLEKEFRNILIELSADKQYDNKGKPNGKN